MYKTTWAVQMAVKSGEALGQEEGLEVVIVAGLRVVKHR